MCSNNRLLATIGDFGIAMNVAVVFSVFRDSTSRFSVGQADKIGEINAKIPYLMSNAEIVELIDEDAHCVFIGDSIRELLKVFHNNHSYARITYSDDFGFVLESNSSGDLLKITLSPSVLEMTIVRNDVILAKLSLPKNGENGDIAKSTIYIGPESVKFSLFFRHFVNLAAMFNKGKCIAFDARWVEELKKYLAEVNKLG